MPPIEVTQYAHGVVVLGSDQTKTLTDPLPSYNPALEDMPDNNFAKEADRLDQSQTDRDTGGVEVDEQGNIIGNGALKESTTEAPEDSTAADASKGTTEADASKGTTKADATAKDSTKTDADKTK